MEFLHTTETTDQLKRDVIFNYGPSVDVDFIFARAAERPAIFGRTSAYQCSKTGFLTLCALAVASARDRFLEFYDEKLGWMPPNFILDPLQIYEGYQEPIYFDDPNSFEPIDYGVRSDLVVLKNNVWGTPDTGLAFNTNGKGNYVVRRDENTRVLLAERIIPNELITYKPLEKQYMPDFGVSIDTNLGMEVRKILYNSLAEVAPYGVYDTEYIVQGINSYCDSIQLTGINLSELTYTESKYPRVLLD